MRFLIVTILSFFTLTLAMAQTDGMKQRWDKIDEYLNQSLPKSALTDLHLLYREAVEKNDPDNQIKALIYIMRCNDMSEEDAFEKDIEFVRQEIKTASFPANAILQSMLGEMYWQYFQRRRYNSNISASTNVDDTDIQTWDQKTILEASIKAFKASLKDKDALLKFNTDVFKQLIYRSGNHVHTANLYDFLGKKALDFFKSSEASVSRPAEQFNLNDVNYFSNSPEFIVLNIQSHDALSLHLYAMQLMQDLEKVHLKDADQTILIDLVLARLKFVSANTGLSNAADLQLATLLKLEQTSLKLPISTDVSFEIAVIWHERSKINSGINNAYMYPDANIKSIQICDAAMARFPNSDGAHNCDNLKNTILKPSLNLTMEEVNLPMQPFRIRVTYNNVPTVSFRIIAITPEEVDKLQSDLNYRYDVNRFDLFKPYIERTAIKKWSVDLIKDPQLREHTTEVVTEALPTGMYLIVASDVSKIEKEKAILGYTFTTVSNISFIARGVEGKTQVYVLSRDTGKPIKDAKVRAFSLEYDYTARKNKKKIIGEFTSDANGYVEVSITDNKRSGYVNFDISTKNDRLVCDNRKSSGFYLYKDEEYNNDRFYERSMMLFTDRSIYRPGQTIYFKGIVYDSKARNTFAVAKKSQVRVTLYDANYKEVSYLDLITNEFGSVQGSFTAPVGSLTGSMHISGDDMANAYFNVEEYKRPKFEVRMQPLTGQYKLNQQVQVKAIAKAYAGNAVDGAEVTYRVVRRAQIPYWYSKYWSSFSNQETVIATGSTTTDNDGAFTVTFAAQPDASVSPDSKPTFVYTVYADVIDINGETHSDELSVSIGYSSLNLSIQIPATIEKGKSTTLSVRASNQSGQPESATIRVQVFKLEAPKKVLRRRLWDTPDKPLLSEAAFHKLFPEDEYENETQIENYPQKLILETVLHTTVDKAGEIILPENWETGQYVVKVSALDADKVESIAQANFTKTDPHSDKLPYAMAEWTNVSPTSTEPQNKAVFELGSSFTDIHVICEIERNGVILRKEFLSIKNDIKRIEQLITEEDRGGLAVHYAFVHNNRVYAGTSSIYVPFTNKELSIHWETFRNKLLPGQAEQWRLTIKKTNGEKMAAELLAGMYDASLDAFKPHYWPVNLYSENSNRLSWNNYSNPTFGTDDFTIWDYYRNAGYGSYKYYDQFNWFNYTFGRNYGGYGGREMRKKSMSVGGAKEEESELSVSADMAAAAPMASSNVTYQFSSSGSAGNGPLAKPEPLTTDSKPEEVQQPAIRKDFRETAFFFPDLKTDSAGNVVLNFSMPEALTRWKMMGLAHTTDMSYGYTQQEVVTQKDLMVVPNAPRFLREGDQLVLSAKVTNLSGAPLKGTVTLYLFDAATMKPIDKELGNTDAIKFFGEANTPSEVKNWSINVPGGYQAITYRVVATAGNFSDGEENVIPVFSNRMLVTESVPMVVTKGQTKTYNLEKLATHKSTTLVNHRLTLELTPNPVWYAVQALSYLAEYPYECAEQTFSRYYANSLAGFVANSSPALKRMFDLWKDLEPDALLSNLEKNQELKMLLLEQTPWLRDAENETEQKRRIGLLFDLTRMNSELDRAISKLEKMQLSNGAFPWFTGMREDRYITQHILTGLGHLKHLGIQGRNDEQIADMTEKALTYCDGELLKDYKELLARAKRKEVILEEVRPSSMEVHYLYGRSFYQRTAEGDLAKALQFYKDQSRKYWTEYSLYEQGLIGLAAFRDGNTQLSGLMHKSFKERAIISEDKGMYWKANEGYYWYQAPIERQALLIEFFEETAKDRASVDLMRFWLLTQKQTTHWKTTKATTEACYALLLNGTSWLNEDTTLSVTLGNTKVDFPKNELSPTKTKVWNTTEIKPEMSKVTLSKQGEGIAWGALHWQYYEDLDKITTHKNTQVQLTKELMLVLQTDTGTVLTPVTASTVLKAGDLVKVKLIIRTDRDLEYVHLQDMRAAGFEPLNVLSGAKWNGSFGYYESTRDASTDFFIGYLPRGTYVFEYSLRVNNAGNFSNGITNIQCMYAPEFNAHSQGIRVNIK
ncbi:alpha-2-macroglobulin family protein [Cytophaga aurantiaca]|uniref:alpha-2-macroglobulin family protein n=1 Tax=Cytophaga aurantiaca TaxID=29530 RepID=UPI000378B35D|nr:alpha-2-macroglobulin family protein [Cytophaga aurantiaca]